MAEQYKTDKVALLSVITGAAGLLLPFSIFRENRIATGDGLRIWESMGTWVAVLVILMLCTAVFMAVIRAGSWRFIVLAILGGALISLIILITGLNAHRILSDKAERARVSLGPGAWLLILSSYILILSSFRNMSYFKVPHTQLFKWLITLVSAGAVFFLLFHGYLGSISLFREFTVRQERFFQETVNHLVLSFFPVLIASAVGIPVGIRAYRSKVLRKPLFFFVNTIQTVPSLALFGIMIIPLSILASSFPILRQMGISGIGWAPAFIALSVYALLPVTRNTFISLEILDKKILEAGRGMGMTKGQLLFRVELPLAFPVVMNGVRTALVQTIGNATVAALIGAGGFGIFVFQGLGESVPDLILLGAIPVVLLAVAADRGFAGLIRLTSPSGIETTTRQGG